MLDPTVTERIRSIFLHHETNVTIEDAARLLGRSGGEIAAATRGRRDRGDVGVQRADDRHS